MPITEKLGPVALVLASSVIINMGLFASNLYAVPGVLTTILVPCTLVMCIGWFQRSMRRTIVLTFSVIVVSAAMLLLTLSAPVVFGVIEDPGYRQLFVYAAFLKVVQYTLVTAFFTLLTALVAGLAFE
ncbi:hypothetical protein JXL21_00385 [Candidatus Bathyarchaeota archaeon]|nr:hypothetical protein [Candidatus Bathyarchaeota archaeon]